MEVLKSVFKLQRKESVLAIVARFASCHSRFYFIYYYFFFLLFDFPLSNNFWYFVSLTVYLRNIIFLLHKNDGEEYHEHVKKVVLKIIKDVLENQF